MVSIAGMTFNAGASAFTLNGNSLNFTGAVAVNSGGGIVQTINTAFASTGPLQLGSTGSTGNALTLGANATVTGLVAALVAWLKRLMGDVR